MGAIKVGIIGYGGSAKSFHLPFILPNPDLEVYAFLQRAPPPPSSGNPSENPPGEREVKEGKEKEEGRVGMHCTIDFPLAKHYRTAPEFFADNEIELVVICSSQMHGEYAEQALKSGKHVVVEKPFVNSSREAGALVELAKEVGRVLTVFHNRRFDSDFRTLAHLISHSALGTPLDATIHFDFPSPSWISSWTSPEYKPGSGAGMTFALGTHTIDQALHLFGVPSSVTAVFRANRGVDSTIEDTFTILLQYDTSQKVGVDKNLLVTIKTAVVSHLPLSQQLRFFVRGTKGTYLKFGSDPQEARAIAQPCLPATDPGYGLEDASIWGTLSTTELFDADSQRKDESEGGRRLYVGKYPSLPGWYRGYYENVVAAIRGEAEVFVKPEEARDGLRVIELARKSWEEKRTVSWEELE